uniref:Uncharacterized protein n=1 Tax=Percolomonas cosmopolitus TaxID=63605 RepID=A0A7S1KTL5_9EUKA
MTDDSAMMRFFSSSQSSFDKREGEFITTPKSQTTASLKSVSVVSLFHDFLQNHVSQRDSDHAGISSQPPPLTTRDRRRILRQFIREVPQHLLYWEPEDAHEIASILDLPLHQVRRCTVIGRVERRFGAPKKYISAEERALVREWARNLDSHKRNRKHESTHNRIGNVPLHLIKELKCSKQQLYDLWKWARQNPGEVNSTTKAKMREWLQENNKDPQSLTTMDREDLQQLTGWSRQQLYRQLQRLRDGNGVPITIESKRILQEWLRENGNRSPNKEERDLLQDLTGWTRQQLDSQITHRRQIPGEIGNMERLTVSTWIREHGFQRPNPEQRLNLVQLTGLSRTQVNSLITQEILSHQAGKMNESTKAIVRGWLQANNFGTPSTEDKKFLLEKTGWNTKQLASFLRRSIRAHKEAQDVA